MEERKKKGEKRKGDDLSTSHTPFPLVSGGVHIVSRFRRRPSKDSERSKKKKKKKEKVPHWFPNSLSSPAIPVPSIRRGKKEREARRLAVLQSISLSFVLPPPINPNLKEGRKKKERSQAK